MSLTPEKYVFGVLLVLGTIVLAPLFAFFFTWKKLFPKYYRKRFGVMDDYELIMDQEY